MGMNNTNPTTPASNATLTTITAAMVAKFFRTAYVNKITSVESNDRGTFGRLWFANVIGKAPKTGRIMIMADGSVGIAYGNICLWSSVAELLAPAK